jgi:N utilization substance protein A
MSDVSVKFDTATIRSINMFEDITGVEVMDAITLDDTAYFVVEEGKMGLAIGKGGKTIKKVQSRLNKDVRVYEYSDSLQEFVKNIVPTDVNHVKYDRSGDQNLVRIGVDRSNWSRVVGKDGKNVKIITRFLKREFGVDDVKIE